MVKWVYDLADAVSAMDDDDVRLRPDLDPVVSDWIEAGPELHTVADKLGQLVGVALVVDRLEILVVGTRRNMELFRAGWNRVQTSKLKPNTLAFTCFVAQVDHRIVRAEPHARSANEARMQSLKVAYKITEFFPDMRDWEAQPPPELVLKDYVLTASGTVRTLGGFLHRGTHRIDGTQWMPPKNNLQDRWQHPND